MKEITAIIRGNRIQKTNQALLDAGYPSLTVQEVLGRGRQRGLQHEFCHELPAPAGDNEAVAVSFIPKRMLTLVVEDENVEAIVNLIIETNQTGNAGDGKIIVAPLRDAVRVRTGENGNDAIS